MPRKKQRSDDVEQAKPRPSGGKRTYAGGRSLVYLTLDARQRADVETAAEQLGLSLAEFARRAAVGLARQVKGGTILEILREPT